MDDVTAVYISERLIDISRIMEEAASDQMDLDQISIRLEAILVFLVEINIQSSNHIHGSVFSKLLELLEILEASSVCDPPCNRPGRPSFDISTVCLQTLMYLKFSAGEIGVILGGVSRSTICRRMRQYGLSYERIIAALTTTT